MASWDKFTKKWDCLASEYSLGNQEAYFEQYQGDSSTDRKPRRYIPLTAMRQFAAELVAQQTPFLDVITGDKNEEYHKTLVRFFYIAFHFYKQMG